MPYSCDNKPSVGDKVIFGRKRGERTKGTIIKVNRTKAKIRQDESRGTMKDHPIGTVWNVSFTLVEPDESRSGTETPVTSSLPPGPVPIPKPVETSALVGTHIVEVRKMTKAEMAAEMWYGGAHNAPTVLVLSNGAKLYPSQDYEGNGGGALFGVSPEGQHFGM